MTEIPTQLPVQHSTAHYFVQTPTSDSCWRDSSDYHFSRYFVPTTVAATWLDMESTSTTDSKPSAEVQQQQDQPVEEPMQPATRTLDQDPSSELNPINLSSMMTLPALSLSSLKDDNDDISALECGSIVPDPNWKPPLSSTMPFSPPIEIRVSLPTQPETCPVMPAADGISLLECGSLKQDPNWSESTADASALPFQPPAEIAFAVTSKPEDDRRGSLANSSSAIVGLPRSPTAKPCKNKVALVSLNVSKPPLLHAPAKMTGSGHHRRQFSNGAISVGSLVGQSTFLTVSTTTASSLASSRTSLMEDPVQPSNGTATRRGGGYVRSELKYVLGKVASPLKYLSKKDGPSAVKLSRAKGCLT